MLDINALEEQIMANKERRGFNTTDLNEEFCHLYGEVAEAYEAYWKKLPDFEYELADVFIYLLSIAKISNIDLEKAVNEKMEINKNRVYKIINGVAIKVEN